ncbi:MAG: GUN4 domain-containing protein [Rhizonema sp. PD38]|nr:GUN4 domain-containing protein [Rhizonema sp. PD38]
MSTQFFLDETDIETLINLLLRSQQSRTREALCLSIGIDPKRLSFIRESSDSDFFLLLISYLDGIRDKEALCKLCCKELLPVFHQGKYATILSEIAVKLNCNQNPSVEQPTSPTPSPVPVFGINPSLQPDGSKSKSKRPYWLTGGAIFLIGLAGLAGFQIYKTESVNPQYKGLERLLSEKNWEEADHETANIMWNLAGKWQERSLRKEDYKKLSCDDLRDIDHLWTKYSNQHFGFSIQRRIFQSSDVNSDLGKFMSHVGWGRVDENKEKGQIVFVFYQVTNFSLSAPEGELPWVVNWQGSDDRQAYVSRIIDYGI